MKLKYIYAFFCIIVIILIIKENISFYGISLANKEPLQDEKDLRIKQLNYLQYQLHSNNIDDKMQKLFPEGYVFCNVLYGLSWCELAENGNDFQIKRTAIREAIYALHKLELPATVKVFNKDCSPGYGIFYQGWCNYLRAKILLLSNENNNISVNFVKACSRIASAIDTIQTPFPESYKNASWPADVMSAIISLKIHDRLFNKQYTNTIQQWLKKVKQKQDPETGLIPHSSSSITGNMLIMPRGSSQSLIIRLLAEIDTTYAKQQYIIYKRLFLSNISCLSYVKEFHSNKNANGDIDSGPVLFGMGSAATVTAIGTSSACGDQLMSQKLKRSIEAAGIPFTFNDKRFYLIGTIPIADLFILWSQLTKSKVEVKIVNVSEDYSFLAFSLLITIILNFPVIYFLYKKINNLIIKPNIAKP